MKPPPWLAELHRQWQSARGGRVAPSARPFTRDWISLLEDAGIAGAADQSTAAREASALEESGRLILKRHRYRKYLIERVALPVASEPWLRGLFGAPSAAALHAEALEIVGGLARRAHPLYPTEWAALCESLRAGIAAGRSPRPFGWRHPEVLRRLLETVAFLTAREWPPGTPVRGASIEAGFDSKGLERHRHAIESGLSRMFGAPTTLKSLGLITGHSHVELHGPLRLHFPDGGVHDFDGLSKVLVSEADLARCSAVSTSAGYLLSVENRKTTFHQYAAANRGRRALIASTSFPTPAFRTLLEKLPPDLPHHHFGDTDPAGWHILLKLREAGPRPVHAFRMSWRPAARPVPPTPYDRKLLPKLLASALLADARPHLAAILDHQDRGDFEQETLGPPGPRDWPD